MFRRAAPLLVLLVATSAHSAPVDSLAAVELLRTHAYPLTLEAGELHGAGADSLWSEGRRRFVVVGEDHGFAEVPRFCAALFRGLHRTGYQHVAIEVGPLSANVMSSLARQREPLAAFRQYDATHPWGLAFLAWQEEAEWVIDAVHTAGGGDGVVWGLDQEFMGSPQMHLERLVKLAKTSASKALAESCLASARLDEQRLRVQHNPAAMWMMATDAATFARLEAAFAPPTSEGGRIVRELEQSQQIYAPFFRGDGYSNNLDRSRLMKRNLGDYLATCRTAGEPAPRVLFKFGGSHTMRGKTVTSIYDMGSTVHELAELEGSRAFGLYIQGASGTQNNYQPFGSPPADTAAAIKPAGSDLYFATEMTGVMPGDSTWRLVDLRPLRRALGGRGSKGVPAALEKVAFSYDAALIVPQMHAARFLNSPFAKGSATSAP
jgi:hypothetical protein